MPDQTMLDTPLLRMPLHLLAMVLSRLDNLRSLASAIFTHPSLYAAFEEDRHRIVRHVIKSEIPPRLMKYALCTYFASSPSLDRGDLQRIVGFLQDNFGYGGPLPPDPFSSSIDMHLVSTLSRTHSIVQYFTDDLLRDMLPLVHQHLGLHRPDHISASPDEVFRIQRAMYRFEIYCNLFRYRYTPAELRRLETLIEDHFLGYFSPWVNDQLVCIHHYFERVLSRAFDEVAAHDISWGSQCVSWLAVGGANEHKQAYLFYGLDFLHKLDQIKTYHQRRELFRSKHQLGQAPRTKHMLGSRFANGSIDVMGFIWDEMADWIRDGDYASVSNWWPNNGPDVYGSAPFRMWYEGQKPLRQPDVINYDLHSLLRRCGYVLWDHPPETAPLSDEELQERFTEAMRQGMLEWFSRNVGIKKVNMENSWKERADIYKEGGRGYWSEGDLSRVTWDFSKKRRDLPPEDHREDRGRRSEAENNVANGG
ncbi:hypothetical protein VTI74DRAFT_3036 [Chaetomium olivicolor]